MGIKWKPYEDNGIELPKNLATALNDGYLHDDPPYLMEADDETIAFVKGLIAARVEGAEDLLENIEKFNVIELMPDY